MYSKFSETNTRRLTWSTQEERRREIATNIDYCDDLYHFARRHCNSKFAKVITFPSGDYWNNISKDWNPRTKENCKPAIFQQQSVALILMILGWFLLQTSKDRFTCSSQIVCQKTTNYWTWRQDDENSQSAFTASQESSGCEFCRDRDNRREQTIEKQSS